MGKAPVNTPVLLSVLYIVGLVLAHTAIGHEPVIVISASLVVVFIAARNAVISKRYAACYWILMAALIVAARGELISTLTVIVATAANILIYEQFSRRPLPKRYVQVLLYVTMTCVLGYAFVTSSWEQAFFNNRNAVPVVLVFMLFMADLYLHDDRLTRTLTLVFVLVFGYTCKSRAGLLAIASYLVLRSVRLKSIQVMVFSGILAYMVLIYATGTMLPPDIQIYGRNIRYLAGREELWTVSIETARRNPLGLGYKGYSEIFSSFFGIARSSHNFYLNVLLQYGWFYAGAYIALLVLLVGDASSPATLAAVFSMHLRGFFEMGGIPFGLSLGSAMLLLPFYMEKQFGALAVKGASRTTSSLCEPLLLDPVEKSHFVLSQEGHDRITVG